MPRPESSDNSFLVRRLLAELLRSAADFDAFCIDHFRDVSARFANGMDRTQKENLLLIHAPTLADIRAALHRRFPDAPIWQTVHTNWKMDPTAASGTHQPVRTLRPRGYVAAAIGALSLGILGLLAMRSLPGPAHEPPAEAGAPPLTSTGCQALAIDDVFVLRPARDSAEKQLTLDVRLRHLGGSADATNVTRAAFLVQQKFAERAAYEPSASYDLLISGNRSEAALAQRIGPGEIDRILIRLGFTKETASYQYKGKLQFLYNGGCLVESGVISLSAATRVP